MEHEPQQHEKIRFRRDEISDLSRFPSAATEPRPARNWFPKRARKIVLGAVAGVVAVVLLAMAALYAIGLSGIGSERLRLAAETALRQVAGVDVDVTMGPARITLDGVRFLALEVSDVSLKRTGGADIAQAGSVRFGVRLLPLLSGDVRVSSASLADARIFAAALGPSRIDWAKLFRNERGLVDPDLVAKALFAGAHQALDAVGSKALRRVALHNVELVLPTGEGATTVQVIDASLAETAGDGLSLSSSVDVGGRAIALQASLSRDRQTDRITVLDITASATQPAQEAATGNRLGAIELKLNGSEGSDAGTIDASVKVAGWVADLGARGILSGDLDLDGRLVTGADRLEIGRLRASIGRSILDFRGLVGPRPATGGATDEPAYRFNLVSARSTFSPDGSPEPALNAKVQLTGAYLPTSATLSADQIVLQGGGKGSALGAASMRFVAGKVPGMSVAFNVNDMPVSQVKQLWPWFSARGARNWVLNNVFGGRVVEGQLQFRVEPGRLGNGVPLSANESFGTFRLEGARFDTAGLIPPVRDATGTVDYKGNDVDITLSSGTVYLPSGRTVAASNGTLAITKANVPPVIGSLDIDVAGEAPAIAELASYDPINAMRFVGLTADDFTGQVSGNVKADIPLQKGIDRDKLNWLVTLDYKDLAIAKPLDGQMVTEAEGTIAIEKTNAVIAAKAKLSGVPAQIDAVEPLGQSSVERKRLITVVLDEKARKTVVPGLEGLIEGPIKVTLDAKGGGTQLVKADVTDAQLNIPWVGWSKGKGIGGAVSFMLDNSNGKSTLSDFDLSGDTFGISGKVTLSGGSLSEAKFTNVKLNRNDAVAVTVSQSGKGYAVDVKGKSLDARSVVRQFTADSATATKVSDGGTVTVSVDVDSVTGFHDEKLSGVKLEYRGSGDRVDKLEVTAATDSGGAVDLSNGLKDGGRALRLTSADAGAVLRFLDLYEHMEGGKIDVSLKGGVEGPLSGTVDARDFVVVNEPRLSSIVSTTPPGGDRSLSQAVKRDIDTSRVSFERLYSQIEKGPGYVRLSEGILRGPLLGASFQGMLYDTKGNMDMTGTFMPAYGLNRIFGEIPIVGVLLGNGRDRGLIGVTFRLEGDADAPRVEINPLSVIAPGIFRSIFEFH
ncbi:MAG: DUF3971 domain-containing protein [Hyphomicrobiales bacterium]|nr:DUF3971 domain-containing protein [Hyphomicrobiales bacterium]